MKKTISITGIILGVGLISVIVLSGCGLKKKSVAYNMSLSTWGVFDNSNAYTDVFDMYSQVNQSVDRISYSKQDLNSYKEDLLDALASGNGPDIFMIHNSWMPDFQDKIVPIPDSLMTEQDYRNNFVDVVADDFIIDNQMYGVPMSVDSLALYYNKDIFNAAGVTSPPKTWDEFNGVVKKLVNIDEFGNIKQIAASMGTAFNINRSVDLLTVLMIQNGTEMSDGQGKILFAEPVAKGGGSEMTGQQALKYYTDFANATTPVYTWNKQQNYSIDDFYEGQSAMMINYSWHYDTIKAKNAKLNFAVTDLPQVSLETIGEQANYANYWVFVVSKNKKPEQSNDPGAVEITDDIRIFEAWQALIALTFPTGEELKIVSPFDGAWYSAVPDFDLTEKYLEITGKPAARRDLISKQQDDVKLGSFASGNLIARTWLRNNATAVEPYLLI